MTLFLGEPRRRRRQRRLEVQDLRHRREWRLRGGQRRDCGRRRGASPVRQPQVQLQLDKL